MINEGKIDKKTSEKRTIAHDTYPYPFDDVHIQEQIYQAYKDVKVLPSILIASSYNAMLQKSGIRYLIQNNLFEIVGEDTYKLQNDSNQIRPAI